MEKNVIILQAINSKTFWRGDTVQWTTYYMWTMLAAFCVGLVIVLFSASKSEAATYSQVVDNSTSGAVFRIQQVGQEQL